LLAQLDKLVRAGVRKRLEQRGVNHGKNGGVRADAQGERDHRDEREARITQQGSRSVLQVLQAIFEPIYAAHVPALLLALFETPNPGGRRGALPPRSDRGRGFLLILRCK